MSNSKTKPKSRRRTTSPTDVVLIPFKVEEIKGLVLEKLGSAKNKGGRPRKT